MTKPPIGLTPRDFWLRERSIECVNALHRFIEIEDWNDFKKYAKTFAEELLYCINEWDKYYEKEKKS